MFKLINKEQVITFYNPDRSNNGDGYNHLYYKFIFKGIEGTFEDTSCGDFRSRYHMEWNGLHANYDTFYNEFGSEFGSEYCYSEFSSSDLNHMELLEEIHNLTGWRIPTQEDYQEEYNNFIEGVFGEDFLNECLDLRVLSKHLDIISETLAIQGYFYWQQEPMKLNPESDYVFWIEAWTYGFRVAY